MHQHPIDDVREFMVACGDTIDHRNVRQTARYIGMQCEELAEKLELIFGTQHSTVHALKLTGDAFKGGEHDPWVILTLLTKLNREEIFDADLDLAWVSIAAAFSLGANVDEGWARVSHANLSKVDSETGYVTRDANGKIQKPAGWTPPNHEGLVP